MSTSTQIIFSRAVKHHLHDAFVSLLDRIDEFQLGAVFTYHGKPHFWRKKELNFTGAQLADLLATSDAAEAGFTYNSDSKVLFDETSDSSERTIDIDLDLDGEVKVAIADVGGDVGGSGKKIVKINVSLGKFTHITTDMGNQFTKAGQKLTANLEHPVMREAVNKGKTLFVISSLFQSEKVEITINREEDVSVNANEKLGNTDGKDHTDSPSAAATNTTSSSDTPATTTTTSNGDSKPEGVIEKVVDEVTDLGKEVVAKGIGAQVSEGMKGDTKAVTTGVTVTKRDRPSNIGFSVLRIEIAKDGSLVPQAKIGVSYDHKIYATYGDAFISLDKQGSSSTGGATSGTSDDKKKEEPAEGRGLEPPKEEDKQKPSSTEKKEDTDGKDTQQDKKDEKPAEDKVEEKDSPKENEDSTPPDN